MTRLLLPLLFLPALLIGQTGSGLDRCGTLDGKVPWLVAYQNHDLVVPRSADTLYLPVTIHLVGTSVGSGYFSIREVLDAFCTLNRDFESSGLQFYLEGDLHYIPNNTYYNHNYDSGSEMMVNYNVPNTINCYISNSPGENLCGYSAYNLGVALAKSCVGPDDHTWSHELGHYLSLPHPFYGWEGYDHDYNLPAPEQINGILVERVDGQDCDIAGDGFCDTDPDYLNYRWNCNGQGLSTVTQTDPLGAKLKSDASLIMSYSSDNCSYRFSDEQIEAMRANALTDKAEFLYDQQSRNPVSSGDVVALYPPDGDTIDMFKEIPFAWEAMPEATHYMIEYSINENFTGAVFQYKTEGPAWTSGNLIKNKTYYWRLRPYNRQFTCPAQSDVHVFTTGDQSTGLDRTGIDGLNGWTVTPNPSPAGSAVTVRLTTVRAMDLQWRLVSLTGQIRSSGVWSLSEGTGTMQLTLPDDLRGLVLLQLTGTAGSTVQKLSIKE